MDTSIDTMNTLGFGEAFSRIREAFTGDTPPNQSKYQSVLSNYRDTNTSFISSVASYIARTNPTTNPYLGKNVSIDGHLFYVTEQGVAKWYSDDNALLSKTAGLHGCPPASKAVVLDGVAWDPKYRRPGETIPSRPVALITGTPMTSGQSCGHEGRNLWAAKQVSTNANETSPKYLGCYEDNPAAPTMTFVGGAPPQPSLIINGQFSSPVLSANTYQYINSSTAVPGWSSFNAVLSNSADTWGFPTPYPMGSQCLVLQQTQQVGQSIALTAGTNYTFTCMTCGRECCDDPATANPVAVQLTFEDTSSSSSSPPAPVVLNTLTPPVNAWTPVSVPFTVSTSGNYTLQLVGTWSSSDRSTAIQGVRVSSSNGATSGNEATGVYSLAACQQAAVDGGYRYFALQDVNPGSATGYCAVSNSEPTATQYGTAYTTNGQIVLWSSGTGSSSGSSTSSGNRAGLTATGSLVVENSGGQVIYYTPNGNAQPSNYLGCYADNSAARAMTLYNNGAQEYDLSGCQQIAAQGGYKYYALQNSTTGTNAQCALSNDLTTATQYGAAGNCTKVSGPPLIYSGGGLSNAIYNNAAPQSQYFLTLADNGNMCIYRGSNPNDNQGEVWCSNTANKAQQANSAYAAAKGKYGTNWVSSGATLSAGDFIGSSSGSAALVMQSNGALVLLTFGQTTNCVKMSDGNMGGGVAANALYDMGGSAVSNPALLGAMAYIDDNGQRHLYGGGTGTSTNLFSFTSQYVAFPNSTVAGNDIAGASVANSSVSACESACTALGDTCAGFVFEEAGGSNTCYPKTVNMYPASPLVPAPGYTTYVRGRQPAQSARPTGVPPNTAITDTTTLSQYPNGTDITGSSVFGLPLATTVPRARMTAAQRRMTAASNHMAQTTTLAGDITQTLNSTVNANQAQIRSALGQLTGMRRQVVSLEEDSANGGERVANSALFVQRETATYMAWSILAMGGVLAAMLLRP